MVPLRVEQYVVGSVSTNCYFAINDDTKEVLIIDPGASAKKLAEKHSFLYINLDTACVCEMDENKIKNE